MKVEPLPDTPLEPGTVIILKEGMLTFWANEKIKPRRLRVVVEEKEDVIITDAFNCDGLKYRGEWSRDMIDGTIKREDVDKFLMWDALTKKEVK